jgi:Flp pilus assembly protein TadG
MLADRRGVAAMELALIFPVLVVMAFGVIDYSSGVLAQMQVQNAAQRGLQYALTRGFDTSVISTVISYNNSPAGISATPAPSQFCGCPDSQGKGISSAACSTVCADGSTAGTYVSVSAAATYVPYVALPFVPASFSLQSTAIARIQ